MYSNTQFKELAEHFGDMDYMTSYKQPKLLSMIITIMNNDNILKKLPDYVKMFAAFYVSSSNFGHFRPQSHDKVSGRTTHINLNFELFMAAGTGKDAIIKLLDGLFTSYNKRAKGKAYELNTLYKELNEGSVYCDDFIMSEGTPEGLQSGLVGPMRQRFGSFRYEHSELFSMIKQDASRDGLTLTSEVVKCHDADKIFSKKLANNNSMNYGGVPFFFWGHTSYHNITDTSDKMRMFQEHLSRGMHRRTILCFVKSIDMLYGEDDFEAYLDSLDNVRNNDTLTEMVVEQTHKIYDMLDTDFEDVDYTEDFEPQDVQGCHIHMHAEAEMLFTRYSFNIDQIVKGDNFASDEVMFELFNSKKIKAKKIATILSIMKASKTIRVKDMELAILFVEALHTNTIDNLDKILNQVGDSVVYEYLKDNLGKTVTKSDIMTHSGLKGSRNKMFKVINDELLMIKNMCSDDGLTLTYNEKSKKSKIVLNQLKPTKTVITKSVTITTEVQGEYDDIDAMFD